MTHPHKIHTTAVFHPQPWRERLLRKKRGGDDQFRSHGIITTGNLGLPCVAMTQPRLRPQIHTRIHTRSTQDPHGLNGKMTTHPCDDEKQLHAAAKAYDEGQRNALAYRRTMYSDDNQSRKSY